MFFHCNEIENNDNAHFETIQFKRALGSRNLYDLQVHECKLKKIKRKKKHTNKLAYDK